MRTSVTPKIEFSLASEADDAEIRRLLRNNPMAGQISLSLEREPEYFTEARHSGVEQQTIVARDRGRIVCVGTCSFRQRFVNGKPRRVGYLGGLRLDARLGGRFDILRRGYRFFHELQLANPADFYFTAIASDNERARQFLERGLPGMPRYDYLGDFVTMLIPVPRNRRHEEADSAMAVRPSRTGSGVRPSPGAEMWPAAEAQELSVAVDSSNVAAPGDGRTPGTDEYEPIAALLEAHHCRYQFAPCWPAEELKAIQPLGLRLEDFCIANNQGKPVACAALWDQRTFKQTVIRGYARPLAWARPWVNFAARLRRRPGLPAVGSTLPHAPVSHLVVPAERPEMVSNLVRSVLSLAQLKGIEWLTLGFAVADPRLAALRRWFAGREYHSRLYRVRWPDVPGDAFDDRLPYPEVALL